MNISELIEFSKENKFWYSVSDVYLQSCLGFSYGFARSQKSFPVHLMCYIFSFAKDHGFEAVALSDAERVAEHYFRRFQKDKKYFIDLEEKWRKYLKLGQAEFDKLYNSDLSKLSNRELYQYYSQLQSIGERFWENIGMVTEAVGAYEENILPIKFKKELGVDENDFFKMASGYKTGTAVIEKYQQNLKNISIQKLKNRKRLVADHIKQYYWIKTGFQGYEELTEADVLEEIENLKKNNRNPKYQSDIQLSHENQELMKFIALMAYWRDARKMFTAPGIYWTFKICEEIARRKNIDKRIVLNTTIDEFKSIIDENIIPPDTFRQRSISFVIADGMVRFYHGRDHLKIHRSYAARSNNQESVTGFVASKGHHKTVSGRARIITNPIGVKISKEEILVAPLTRPEYLPLMKNAKAVVTDLGGITSHAAIVSRELGISCVIGTQDATKVFKDGDIIELDLLSGIVRKKK